MKKIVILSLLLFLVFAGEAQQKKRSRVKRKYRNVEQLDQSLPSVLFRGRVRSADKIPLAGVNVEIDGLKRRVHTNEFGEFVLTGLPTGKLRIKISCIGYQTKTIDYMLQPGFNDHYIALDMDEIHLEPLIVTAQKREQQIPDVSTGISAVSASFTERMNMSDLSELAGFIPELDFENPGSGTSGFSIRGSTGSVGFPGVSSSVAMFSDGVPVIQPVGFSADLIDMERTEVIRGPQNTLFGRNASGGAVHFISKKPQNDFEGYLTAGGGNFGKKTVRTAVNFPVVEDMLFVRAAGMYHEQDGYVENTLGGTLNGGESYGGRFSVRFLPAFNHKIDLALNYQKEDETGMAFMNGWIPNEEGETDIFSYRASLGKGEDLGAEKELMDATLTYRFFRNEHNYWTSVSSYRKAGTAANLDADGTAATALGMNQESDADLFFQEVRMNFSRRSRTNGSAGMSYRSERREHVQGLSSNDQLLFHILNDPGNFVMPAESRFPVKPQPLNPNPMAGYPLSGDHSEEVFQKFSTQSVQAWFHLTHQLTRRLFFTGGVRGFYERLKLSHEVSHTGGGQSTLGQLTGSAPNLLYKPVTMQNLQKNGLSFTGQAGITYRWNENIRYFINAARGRRPPVLQFTWDGRPQTLDDEKVNSLEAGWKMVFWQRIYWDVTGYYRNHINVHTLQWKGTPGTGLLAANGKATSYGAETGLRVAVIRGLDVFGNYAWLQSGFDSTGVAGQPFSYAGNSFALAPEHSYTAGFRAHANILPSLRIFATPWYAWKSHFWFTGANIAYLEQPAYGLLNMNIGLELADPHVILNIYGTNLLEEEVLSSAGHWGGVFGIPSFVPGPPRMVGVKMTWKF